MQSLVETASILSATPMEILVKKLNQTLRGWANYHRHVVSSAAFNRIDTYVFEQLWRMLRRRHQGKSRKWLFRKYWTAGDRRHTFAVRIMTRKGLFKVFRVVRIASIGIRRHIKIIAETNPYSPQYAGSFRLRRNKKDSKLLPALSA